MENNAFEFTNILNITRKLRFCILSRRYNEPSSRICLDFAKVGSFAIYRAHLPATSGFIVAGRYDVLIEARAKLESGGVGLQVLYVVERGEGVRIIGVDGEQRKLAETLGKMKMNAVVSSISPQRGNAIRFFED